MKKILLSLSVFALGTMFANAQTVVFNETFSKLTSEVTENALDSNLPDETGYVAGGGQSAMKGVDGGVFQFTGGRFKTRTMDLTGENVTLSVKFRFVGVTGTAEHKRLQIDMDKEGTSGMGTTYSKYFDEGGNTAFETMSWELTGGTATSFIHFRAESELIVEIDEIKVTKGGSGEPEVTTLEWIVGDDATNFPVASGFAEETVVKGLTIYPCSPDAETKITNMGQVEASAKKFGDINYPNRFKFNGAGYPSASDADAAPKVNMPTQRYLSFQATGNCKVTIQGVTGSSGSSRKVFLTDGTNLIGSFNFPAGSDISEEVVEYSGEATTLYLFCNAACNIYYIKAEMTKSTSTSTNPAQISGKAIIATQYYNLLGAKVDASTTGIVIEKNIYKDGTSTSKKVLK